MNKISRNRRIETFFEHPFHTLTLNVLVILSYRVIVVYLRGRPGLRWLRDLDPLSVSGVRVDPRDRSPIASIGLSSLLVSSFGMVSCGFFCFDRSTNVKGEFASSDEMSGYDSIPSPSP